jgi:dihydrofolate reductase
MRKVICYIAISLDGKIADAQGGVEWLEQLPNPEGTDYGYAEFLKPIDTTIMGNSTYKQVRSFPGEFAYKHLRNFVLTKSADGGRDEFAEFISADDVAELIGNLKSQPGKDIWLIGGGKANALFLNQGLLDELRVFVMPIVLGDGIPLFAPETQKKEISLINNRVYSSGVVELIYSIKN